MRQFHSTFVRGIHIYIYRPNTLRQNYRVLLRKVTYKERASYGSSPSSVWRLSILPDAVYTYTYIDKNKRASIPAKEPYIYPVCPQKRCMYMCIPYIYTNRQNSCIYMYVYGRHIGIRIYVYINIYMYVYMYTVYTYS